MNPIAQKKIFEKNNIPVLGEIKFPATIEGGDVAWLDENTLAVGHTYRTNKEGIDQLKNLLIQLEWKLLLLNFRIIKEPTDVFHLMSILSPG